MDNSLKPTDEPVPQPQAEQCGQPEKAAQTLPEWRLDCEGGTTFTLSAENVTITRSDQPICMVPLKDFIAATQGILQLAADQAG